MVHRFIQKPLYSVSKNVWKFFQMTGGGPADQGGDPLPPHPPGKNNAILRAIQSVVQNIKCPFSKMKTFFFALQITSL